MFNHDRLMLATSGYRVDHPTLVRAQRSGEVIQNLRFDLNAKEGVAAIGVNGKDGVHIRNVEQIGKSMLLMFQGAKACLADGLLHNRGNCDDKVVYSGQPGISERLTLMNFDFRVDGPHFPLTDPGYRDENLGEHGMRFHGWKHLTLENGRVWYGNSKYKGAAITVKDGENVRLQDLEVYGPVGFGPQPEWANNPAFAAARLNAILIDECHIVTPGCVRFAAGCQDVFVRTCLIESVPWPTPPAQEYPAEPSGTCLSLDGPNGNFPAPSGVFVDCHFRGTRPYYDSTDLSRWKFYNCTFNGKAM